MGMDKQEIKSTEIWQLFEKGRSYHHRTGIYVDTDRNYRMYNGNQWEGVNLGDIEPIQKNFIKPIVKYKVAVIHDNLYAIVYSSMNYQDEQFRKTADMVCNLLNAYAASIWELDKMDYKGRRICKDSAINDEGIIFVDFDEKTQRPVNEIVKKNDVYYGNENDDDIQGQPYILIRKRMPVSNAIDFALSKGMPESKKDLIISDSDTFEESGEAAKQEVDDQVTIVYKFYKKEETVHFAIATRYTEIVKDKDTGLSHYPIAHMNWEEREGCARGEGEVRHLIPNQIEVNKTEMRRVLSIKSQAFPHKVVDESRVSNPEALDYVGGTLKTQGQTVDDVRKVVGYIAPAQMSPDVKVLQDDLIQFSRELAGAGDAATGQINPNSASGRAVLAVQNASRAPLTEQRECYKNFVEDVARIWLDYIIVHAVNGIDLPLKTTDPNTGEEFVQIVNVPQITLQQLQATVKVDITPKSVYDRFAQEQTLENMLLANLFSPQRVSELEVYVSLLDDDSVAPKRKLLDAIKRIKDNQAKIARIEASVQAMQQRVNNFISEEPAAQAQQIADGEMRARMMQAMQQAMVKKQAEAAEKKSA